MKFPKRLLAGVAVLALVAGACSSTAATPTAARRPPDRRRDRSPDHGPRCNSGAGQAGHHRLVAHQHGQPGKSIFQGIADAYMAAHPNVKINITVLENEAFKTKLATATPVRLRRRTCSSRGAAA